MFVRPFVEGGGKIYQQKGIDTHSNVRFAKVWTLPCKFSSSPLSSHVQKSSLSSGIWWTENLFGRDRFSSARISPMVRWTMHNLNVQAWLSLIVLTGSCFQKRRSSRRITRHR